MPSSGWSASASGPAVYSPQLPHIHHLEVLPPAVQTPDTPFEKPGVCGLANSSGGGEAKITQTREEQNTRRTQRLLRKSQKHVAEVLRTTRQAEPFIRTFDAGVLSGKSPLGERSWEQPLLQTAAGASQVWGSPAHMEETQQHLGDRMQDLPRTSGSLGLGVLATVCSGGQRSAQRPGTGAPRHPKARLSLPLPTGLPAFDLTLEDPEDTEEERPSSRPLTSTETPEDSAWGADSQGLALQDHRSLDITLQLRQGPPTPHLCGVHTAAGTSRDHMELVTGLLASCSGCPQARTSSWALKLQLQDYSGEFQARHSPVPDLRGLVSSPALQKIEDNNSRVFTVDVKASEHQVKQATEKLPDFDLAKVNTWSGLLQRGPSEETQGHLSETARLLPSQGAGLVEWRWCAGCRLQTSLDGSRESVHAPEDLLGLQQLESVRSEQGPVHPVTVQTSTRDRGREGHCGGHPQGPRGRVSALSFAAAPGAEASDACNHQEPGPTGPPHRSRACLSTTSANTSCRASVLPSPRPSLRFAGCPGHRVRAEWVEPAPQHPNPPPGARRLHRAPNVPGVGPKERRGQRAAFSKLSGVWTTEDPPAPTPPPNGLGSRGGRGPALRPRLLFTPPLPLDPRPRRAAETRVGRDWGGLKRGVPRRTLHRRPGKPPWGLGACRCGQGGREGSRRFACVLPVSPAAPEAPLLTARARNAASRRPRRAWAPPSPGTPAGGHARTRSTGHARPRVLAAGLARGAGRTDGCPGVGGRAAEFCGGRSRCPRTLRRRGRRVSLGLILCSIFSTKSERRESGGRGGVAPTPRRPHPARALGEDRTPRPSRSDRRLGVRLRGSPFCGSPGIRRSRAQTAVSPH
ncbi:unnamed protein product [Rangifer tarandus platyrhynchus]|uniref:Uncharacterized protein n=2 Tax=Rangifer tarandus platyrhynchus TaxID=3082113 RepID=A0ACB0EN94_RANTA|nr:unnamed protein product [Rangifer tarandus platyrhynchus]CAI9702028.1 unnamed protein product [Rangifer tarandus platyrhynchus]